MRIWIGQQYRRTSENLKLGPISCDTPYLGNAIVEPFALVDSVSGNMTVDFEMTVYNRAWFGEKISVTFVVQK